MTVTLSGPSGLLGQGDELADGWQPVGQVTTVTQFGPRASHRDGYSETTELMLAVRPARRAEKRWLSTAAGSVEQVAVHASEAGTPGGQA